MSAEDWRGYARALADAAKSLGAFTERLAAAGRDFEPFADQAGVLGYRELDEAHGKLVHDLQAQAYQAGLKHETPREP